MGKKTWFVEDEGFKLNFKHRKSREDVDLAGYSSNFRYIWRPISEVKTYSEIRDNIIHDFTYLIENRVIIEETIGEKFLFY